MLTTTLAFMTILLAGTGGHSGTEPTDAEHMGATFAPGLTYFGVGTPGCLGLHSLTPTAVPNIGTPDFGFLCTNAPPMAHGLIVIADAPALVGSDPLGIGVVFYLDLASSLQIDVVEAIADGAGNASGVTQIPNDPALIGVTLYAQAFFWWSNAPCSPAPISSSNGVAITFMDVPLMVLAPPPLRPAR